MKPRNKSSLVSEGFKSNFLLGITIIMFLISFARISAGDFVDVTILIAKGHWQMRCSPRISRSQMSQLFWCLLKTSFAAIFFRIRDQTTCEIPDVLDWTQWFLQIDEKIVENCFLYWLFLLSKDATALL